jgi:hypothetical protein
VNHESLRELSDAFDAVGHPIYSDELLGRVLAWACLSGFCEACVLNKALHAVVMIAARRFGIEGGHVPDVEKMDRSWRPAMRELERDGKDTPWLRPLMARYKVAGWERLNYREWSPEFRVAAAPDLA